MTAAIQETLKLLPALPGVYQMRNKEGTIIYVGKAKILRNRVRSYFNGQKDPKTTVLVSHIHSITYIVTNTEYEALILENNLIKEHKPKYNINLKDDKTYPVIKLSKEQYPRVFRTRSIVKDGAQYFGPFPDVNAIDQYLELIENYFPLRKCRGPLKKRSSPCLYYHIKRCPAPCWDKGDPAEYEEHIKSIKALLSGKTKNLERQLSKKMTEQSKALEFEGAAKTRDALKSLQIIGESQKVQDFNPEDRDYISFYQEEERLCVVVFKMREGKLLGTERFRTEEWHEVSEEIDQILMQYYQADIPSKIFLAGVEDLEPLRQYLSEQAGRPIKILAPASKKDEAILAMARENARQEHARWKTEAGDLDALKDLQALLELPALPLRIEGFDIAQLQGKHTVAAMVSFWKGIPDKAQYRIFKMRTLDGAIDDYESLREATARRYTRVLNENLERPNLILIDGGKGQLNAVYAVLKALGLESIPLCSLAKEDEEVYLPGISEPLRIPEGSPALRILQAVRDESHRFGTSRNQTLRSKDIKFETLESLEGIGPGRAKKLMTFYGSLEALANTSPETLYQDTKIPKKLCESIYQALESLRKKEGSDSGTSETEEVFQDLAAENSESFSPARQHQKDSD